MDRHILSMHTEGAKPKEKPYKCNHCVYETSRRSDLDRHITGIHFRYDRFTQPQQQQQQQQQPQPQPQPQPQQIQVPQQITQVVATANVIPGNPPSLPTQPIPPNQINQVQVQVFQKQQL